MTLLAPALAGCAGTNAEQPAAPAPANYREMAREYLRRTLPDPYSVRDAAIAAPQMKGSFYLVDPSPGWTICVRYNAKNRMGAYVGLVEDALLVRGNQIKISLNELTPPTPPGRSIVPGAPGICGGVQWMAFPELEQEPRR